MSLPSLKFPVPNLWKNVPARQNLLHTTLKLVFIIYKIASNFNREGKIVLCNIESSVHRKQKYESNRGANVSESFAVFCFVLRELCKVEATIACQSHYIMMPNTYTGTIVAFVLEQDTLPCKIHN